MIYECDKSLFDGLNIKEMYCTKNIVDEIPLVSIITVYYNCRETIKRTIQSVIKQSYKNLEYIIIDDGSDDQNELTHVFSEFERDIICDFPIYLVRKLKNGGVHTARNIGVALARGKFIVNIDADDELVHNTI